MAKTSTFSDYENVVLKDISEDINESLRVCKVSQVLKNQRLL